MSLALMQVTAERIGRYEVQAELGRGSTGVVYQAHDPVVRRKVALKTISIPRSYTPEEEFQYRRRFLQEAQIAGGLSHPGIVTIYDFSENSEQGEPFLAMEYVPGRSVKEILHSDDPLEPDGVFEVIDAAAEALHCAHQADVVHRDIKPANLLVRDSDGAVKITDFGVARIPVSDLTQPGSLVGSPAYMAPERLGGQRAGPTSDLFSLAVIMYEMLAGTRPFSGDDPATVMAAILHQVPVPVTEHRADLPPGIDPFFEQALAKDPRARHRDGAEFRAALREIWSEHRARRDGAAVDDTGSSAVLLPDDSRPRPAPSNPAADSPTPTPWPRPRWAELAGVGFVVLCGIVLVWGLRASNEGAIPADRPISESPPVRSLALEPANELEPGFFPLEKPLFVRHRVMPETPIPTRPEPEPRTVELTVEEAATSAALEPAAPESAALSSLSPASETEDDLLVPGAPAPTAPVRPDARIELTMRSTIKQGTLTLLLDGETLLTLELAGVQEPVHELLPIPAGEHTLVARLETAGGKRSRERTLVFQAEPGETRTLNLKAGQFLGRIGRRLSATLE